MARHAAAGMWFPRTAPKTEGRGPVGVQQFPFSGTSMFNAGNGTTAHQLPAAPAAHLLEQSSLRPDTACGAGAVAQIVPCNLSTHDGRQTTSHSFVVDAWSDPGSNR